jgi:peroxiredoxin
MNQMAKVSINAPAPDFTLEDYQGNRVTLSDYKGEQNVLLVFNRGFQ